MQGCLVFVVVVCCCCCCCLLFVVVVVVVGVVGWSFGVVHGFSVLV